MLLTRDITKLEIHQALFSLPFDKSPGPDGFNVEFYRFFWDDIGDHHFDVIRHFFSNSVLPSSWNKTFITLIPKKPNPNLVSDFVLFLFVTFAIKSFLISWPIVLSLYSLI